MNLSKIDVDNESKKVMNRVEQICESAEEDLKNMAQKAENKIYEYIKETENIWLWQLGCRYGMEKCGR
ncbi:MAG: hypothetical protein PV340_05015 [Wolbachia sp.]|nr:hypothetical protein [Wolbachia sp.]MDD9336360.1 hypothetical protein [Wolbachia sp.]